MRVSTAVASAALVGLVTASSSHNAIRRPAVPRRLDSHAVSDPVAERGLLDALFGTHSGTGTWYGVGVSMGACGSWTSPGERAVALNQQLYGNPNAVSPWCGKKLKIKSNGVTSFATVVDCCPTCANSGSLDMSKILFQDFSDLGTGELDISWSWVGADGGNNDNGGHGGNSPSSHNNNNNNDDNTPKHTSTPKPKPTHTSTTTKTTSTKTSTTKTKTKTKKTKTHKATSTPTADSNLANLGNVISGFQNLAHAGQA
ncbi:hypothetical protein OC845_002324 [Tilletia horrida]|nr:hypothetical protein OC845_002324 [Tilletia horrida]